MRGYTLILVGVICLFVAAYASQRKVLATSASIEGLETLTLDSLSKKYEPVIFSHEMHTEVAESCATCHHTPSEETLACSDCHTTPLDPENESKLGLKGAYHRQCLGCHRDSESGPTGCTDCHAKRGAAK
ncbi:MAG: cytochrome c3 family protein [Deltaproteobacteria bacterium]|nr:cytochrome c3 family protein [Deltaproteobacteria bacterium]